MMRELTRYGVKGGAFVGLNIATQIVLVEVVGIRPAIAAALSTAAMPLLGYVAMNRFVFPDAGAAETRTGYAARFIQYYGVNISSKAVNYALFLAFLSLGVWYPLAYLLGAALVFLATFTINRRLWHGGVTA